MGANHPTRTVLVPSGWMRFGAGRFGSCVKPTGPRRAGAAATGSTVALNCRVATSTPAPEINSTSQRAVPPGAALQSVTCTLDGAIVVDVDVVVVAVVVVEVVTGADGVSRSACSGPLTAPMAAICRASLMARASCTTHPEPAGI